MLDLSAGTPQETLCLFCMHLLDMFTHIRKGSSEEISPGVQQRTLVYSGDTSYQILDVKLLSIDPGMETVPMEANEERICFFLDGRGTASVRWLKAIWRHPVKADIVLWIPGLRHQIRNCGDATLRCLVVACKAKDSVDDRYVFPVIRDARTLPPTSYTGGSEVFIFTPGALGSGSKFNYCGTATTYVGSSTDPHVPTDQCEETMYVTRGEGTIIVGDEKRSVEPGSLAYVPRGTLHCEQNVGQELLEYVIFENHD